MRRICIRSSGCGPIPAQYAEDGLHKERRLEQFSIQEMRQGIEVPHVGISAFEAGA